MKYQNSDKSKILILLFQFVFLGYLQMTIMKTENLITEMDIPSQFQHMKHSSLQTKRYTLDITGPQNTIIIQTKHRTESK